MEDTALLHLPTGMVQYGPYSPSRLETALCGHAFYKQYVDPDRSRSKSDGLAAARGSVVHEVFERMNVYFKKGQFVLDRTEVQKWVTESLIRYPAAYEDLATIWACIEAYADNPPKDMPEDAEIEVKLALDVNLKECPYDSKAALIRGRADLLWFDNDLRAHILDYKTQPHIEDADTFQMGIYALVISKTYAIEEVYTQIYFARYGKYSKPHLWTREALADVERVMLSKIEYVENRTAWEATAHNGCQYCPYQVECPIYKDNFVINPETGTVSIADSNVLNPYNDVFRAQKLASILIQMAEIISLGNKNLREFIKQNGQPVVCGNKAYMYKVEEGIDYKYINKNLKRSLFELMEKHKVDGRNYCNFNKTSFEPVFFLESEKEDFIKELTEQLPRDVGSSYGCYKV